MTFASVSNMAAKEIMMLAMNSEALYIIGVRPLNSHNLVVRYDFSIGLTTACSSHYFHRYLTTEWLSIYVISQDFTEILLIAMR